MYKSKYLEKIQSKPKPVAVTATEELTEDEPTFEVKTRECELPYGLSSSYSACTSVPMRCNSAQIKRTPFKVSLK